MARNRTISPDFWTTEAVVDFPPMTRLLFIGLWNFADDFGVQPLRPRTIRLQVFPGDPIGDEEVRAMIEALAAQGLVRLYKVEGQDYVAVVEWEQYQRVGKRARRRYPAFGEEQTAPTRANQSIAAAAVADAGAVSEQNSQTIEDLSTAASAAPAAGAAGEPPSPAMADQSNVETTPSPSPRACGQTEAWREAIGTRLRAVWHRGRPIEAMDPAETGRWIDRWIAGGCDLEHDVLPAVRTLRAPPVGLHELALDVSVNHSNRLAAARLAA